MKILITFEEARIALHLIDVVRLLAHRGHEVYFYSLGTNGIGNTARTIFGTSMHFLNELGDVSQYDIWMYDLISWDSPKSPLIAQMEKFSGKMVCLGNGDGAGFSLTRTSEAVRDKTSLFMRNTLFLNRNCYHPSIVPKLFLSTCYIYNSQDFKRSAVPFKDKLKRAIFTGSLTGFSENGDPERHLCRIKVPMAVINGGIPCVYRLHNSNPQWKKLFDDAVPPDYKTTALSRPDFIREMETSMIVLSLRGNYHTVNRFFEGQASGGLVFSTKFRDAAEFYGHGDPGVHYVEIEWDGSDVVEKAKYYLEHTDEAEIIAANGRKLWEDCSMLDDNNLLPQKVMDYYVEGIKRIGGINI